MKALDTNVLVRFLVNDDKAQGKKARDFLENAEEKGDPLFVPMIVLMETIWVLDSVYEFPRNEIIHAMELISQMAVITLEKPDTVLKFIDYAKGSKTPLSDLLIGASAEGAGCDTTLTFDIKASKSDLFQLLR